MTARLSQPDKTPDHRRSRALAWEESIGKNQEKKRLYPHLGCGKEGPAIPQEVQLESL